MKENPRYDIKIGEMLNRLKTSRYLERCMEDITRTVRFNEKINFLQHTV